MVPILKQFFWNPSHFVFLSIFIFVILFNISLIFTFNIISYYSFFQTYQSRCSMISHSCKLFPKNLTVNFIFPTYNITSKHKLKDSIVFKKFFLYSKINSHGYRFGFQPFKLSYSSNSRPFSERKVDFLHIPVRKDLVNNINSLGIKDLKLFQYIIFKVLNDKLKSEDLKSFFRLIFYNDFGSGQSIGTFFALLNVYSSPLPNETSQERSPGSLLVLCSNNSFSKISNLILGINPSCKLLVLDEGSRGQYETSNHTDSVGNYPQSSSGLIGRILRDNLIFREDSYDVILASHSYLPKISLRKKTLNFPLLSHISCILFEDFTHLINSDNDLFNYNIKLLRESKKQKYPDFESKRDFHIICLINSLNDKFPEYSKKHLSNYSLYDFKYGTKQRLISDDKTDILKVEVDFGETGIINLQTDENYENKSIEHSICKVSKTEKYDRLTVLKNLVYSYLDLPTFMSSKSFPMCLKRPTPKAKCIIFVSNRNQIKTVANTEEFSNLSVYLGRHLNVYERAKSISSFNNGSKPIMIATDHSIYGSTFEDVSYIFNFNPPKNSESYKSRVNFIRKINSLCVTLYSKDQYHSLVKVIRECTKKVSVHIIPSKEYMMKHDMNWLRKFTKQLITENKNTIAAYMEKAEDLLTRYGDSIILIISNLLLRDKLDVSMDNTGNEGIISRSIFSGKEGFTAVEVKDESKQYLKDEVDLKRLLLKYFQESKVNSMIGRSLKTENGYIIDVSNKYMKNFIQLSKDNQDLYVQVPSQMPKIMINLNNMHIGKVHRKGLDDRSIKIRKPPRIESEINVSN